jgi:NADH-quinone oxidoreductase subunit G
MYANIDPREPDPVVDPDSSLAFSMEGPRDAPPPLLPRYWAPGWNSDQAINKFQAEVGGALSGGEIGVRIFSSSLDREALREAAASAPPPAFARRADALLILPRRHVFGSEELSAKAPALASRIPEKTLYVSVADAGRLGLAEGKLAEISFFGAGGEGGIERLVIPAALADLPEGIASLPWGLPGLPGAPLQAWATVRAAEEGA